MTTIESIVSALRKMQEQVYCPMCQDDHEATTWCQANDDSFDGVA